MATESAPAVGSGEVVFSTSDIEDEDEEKGQDVQETVVESNENIITQPIPPIQAFQRFGGQVFEPRPPPQEYVSMNADEQKFEGPLQKFRRLQSEMDVFLQELTQLAEKASSASDPTANIVDQITSELQNAFTSIETLKSNPSLAPLFDEAYPNSESNVSAQFLFRKLEEFQAQRSAGGRGSDESNRAVFTLYSDGSMNNSSLGLQDVENRLRQIETILGPLPERLSHGDVITSIEYLSSRLEPLADESRLESIVRRAARLKEELKKLNRKDDSLYEEHLTRSKQKKIEDMFTMMTQWDEAAQQLPAVITRLHSLQSLHEHSSGIVDKVAALETQQELISRTLNENKDLLGQALTSLSQNAELIMQNVQSLEERMAKLTEQIGRL